jgi:hypothetical protein
MVLAVFITRFLFGRAFPQFDVKLRADAVIAKRVAHEKLDQSAVDWISESLFVTCLFDAAFCLRMALIISEIRSPGNDMAAYHTAADLAKCSWEYSADQFSWIGQDE